jgi:glycosyltransferase involved in cell wall biosynthesis
MVESVRKSVGKVPYEIILIDCGSKDGTRAWIRKQEDIVLLTMEKPEGSARAFQLGFEAAKHPYVVTLNDDITVDGDSIERAYSYMQNHPEVGQVAFAHRYQNRGQGVLNKQIVMKHWGYKFGQCCMTRKFLGDWAEWTGTKQHGWKHYAWDAHLGLSIWRFGYQVVELPRCSVTDYEYVDPIRKQFADQPRAGNRGVHPDNERFNHVWKNVLPKPREWIPAPVERVLQNAANGTLRLLRFKGIMSAKHPMRHGMVDAFAEYGISKQVNQSALVRNSGKEKAQKRVIEIIKQFSPDLVFFQSQRPGYISPQTMVKVKKQFPGIFTVNFDGDTHYPMTEWHARVARSVDLQLVISPDLFDWYLNRGVDHIGYWPISVEHEFYEADRSKVFKERHSPDILFLGTLYGLGKFPEAETRRDAVVALHKAKGISLQLNGYGWHTVGIKASPTIEHFGTNPERYCKAKMALSISQTKHLWGYTSDRAYNIMATGCPIVVQKFNGMEEHGFVDGKTCISWVTIPEMVRKVRYYKNHPQEREEIGQAGRQLILGRHLWTHRVEGLFNILGGLESLGGRYE